MSQYGYLNHTSTEKRDEEAITAMFAILPCECVAIEQMWSLGEKKRPIFSKLLAKIKPGDTLYVHSIDRLGIDVKETVKVWKAVTREKQADIVVINDPRLNTRENGTLTLPQVRVAAQRAFDNAQRLAEDNTRLYTAFQLVTTAVEPKKAEG